MQITFKSLNYSWWKTKDFFLLLFWLKPIHRSISSFFSHQLFPRKFKNLSFHFKTLLSLNTISRWIVKLFKSNKLVTFSASKISTPLELLKLFPYAALNPSTKKRSICVSSQIISGYKKIFLKSLFYYSKSDTRENYHGTKKHIIKAANTSFFLSCFRLFLE